ncbi:MBL fold metallo-hydrolase [Candidatus Thorarchaeota archaeon]|nr:MAG: MBL fold metallo-hydrolase [Candidatus Thorarchaeota archaeon]
MFQQITEGIHLQVSSTFDSNIGLIESGDRLVLIDSGTGAHLQNLEKALLSLDYSIEDITDIALTHSHIDHIGGVAPIMDRTDVVLHLHEREANRINAGDMQLTLSSTFGVKLPKMKIDRPFRDGDELKLGELQATVIHTPGHSEGSCCFYFKEEGVMFTGDTLFAGGSFGRVDFPTGNPQQLVESLEILTKIEFSTALPGHMRPMLTNAQRSAMSSYKTAKSWFNV